ncbi:MAG: hypothetical protein J6K22_06855 [Spirochaetaceae bacterium]|nr:hypothetical protein [Spirochaetaceae bacterium]MBQ3024526.1 hypothetical protein [Spirochaetaceae bacterium]
MIKIKLSKNIDVDELVKAINFVSPFIKNIKILSSKAILINIKKEASADDIKKIDEDVTYLSQKFVKIGDCDEILYKNDVIIPKYFDVYKKNDNLIFFTNYQIGFTNKGLFLFEYFDTKFKKFAMTIGAIEKVYPVLITIREYLKTGYIKKTPQATIFCNTIRESIKDIENLDAAICQNSTNLKLKEPEFVLSPSACFHSYIEYQNRNLDKNLILTFKQNVFRNEGRLNFKEKGRLIDYHVREIVFIGDSIFVEKKRHQILKKIITFIEELGLSGRIVVASDSFILPKLQRYRSIQKIDKSKFEVQLNIEENRNIAVASLNLHGKSFSDPFNISVNNVDTVTGCVGFGIQRWILAFISQYGWDVNNWPNIIKEVYIKTKGDK